MDQLPLEKFENSRELELLICQNTLNVQNLVSRGENI
jgi:hypothetical protein